MADKKAFVFDTNFIIQNKELDVTLNKLEECYSVYVTQVSIDERIAQNCRKLREDFDEAERCKAKHGRFINMTFKRSFEEESALYKTGIQARYEEYFGDNIIPFKNDSETLSKIIDRANKRLPPFSSAKDASDKGFKDCLLWISLLDYFKDNGEDQVVFLTDDKSAFRNHVESLSEEFKTVTGKIIEFKPNSYYNELITPKKETDDNSTKEEIPNLSQLRDKINNVIYALCGCESEDGWGNEYWYRYFKMTVFSDLSFAKAVMDKLPKIIENNIFEIRVSAYELFDDGRLLNDASSIPMEAIETAHRLHKEIKDKYSDYLDQFYLTVSNILNTNYELPPINTPDNDLPF